MSQSEILTIAEVAKYLRVSERTIYEWAAKAEIPCGKIGTTWRFKRTEIEKWVNNRIVPANKNNALPENIHIKNILEESRVLELKATNKKEALSELVNTFAYDNKEEIKQAILAREKLMSTGIGFGIAIPHIRSKNINHIIMAVGISKAGLADYESMDSEPIHIIFMILAGQDQHSLHIKTLAAISKKFKNNEFKNELLKANNTSEIFNILTRG